jgi:TrmH family RNA methyltransferase
MIISSRSNPKIKQARALRRRKMRQETGLFLVEGIRHVGEAVEAQAAQAKGEISGVRVEHILYAPDLLTSNFAQELIDSQSSTGIPCYSLTADVLESIASKENPQGILAVVHKDERPLGELNPHNFAWGVALDQPQDPGNVGTVLRSIDAVGASGLILLGHSVDPYHPNAVRASMGALFWYPVVQTSFEEFAQWTQKYHYHVYGTSVHGGTDFRKVTRYAHPRILLMGSEREGLSPQQASLCDELIRLPMLGRATSLNLGVSTGIFLYEMLARD